MSTDDHAQEFAAAALQAFDDRGLTTDEQVRSAGGPSNTTMTALRKAARGDAQMREPRSDMLRRIEEAAGWHPGEGRRLWRTGEYPESRNTPPAWAVSRSRDPLDLIMLKLGDLEDRIDRLEQEQSHGDAAPTTRAAGSAATDDLAGRRGKRERVSDPDDDLSQEELNRLGAEAAKKAARKGKVEPDLWDQTDPDADS